MKKVIISACLLGHLCRYDGKTKKTTEIVEAFSEYEIIPFCPEAPLFGTPRERISVVSIDGKNKIITDETNKDVTALLYDEISSFINTHQKIDSIILKSKSPSCGYGTTPILDKNKKLLYYGNGIGASLLEKAYENIKILDEFTLSKR